jgi:hypothetical protein
MLIKDAAARAFMLVFVISLGGCATAYQSKGMTGGFSETDLGPTSFKIAFSGNGFTSPERASDFAMLRAADKSIEDGCNYFGVMNEADGGSTSSVTIANAGYGRHGAWGSAFTAPIFKPNSMLLIKCFAVQPPGAELFDAHYIAHSIRTKYRMPDGSVQQGPQSSVAASQAAPGVVATSPAQVASPPANIAQQVLAAQRISTSQGCGDVSANPDATFQASCPSGTMIIECDGSSCRPVRMKSD